LRGGKHIIKTKKRVKQVHNKSIRKR